MPKARVRELAREFRLVIAEKADSQDICFVPSGHYTDMIERLMPGASVPGISFITTAKCSDGTTALFTTRSASAAALASRRRRRSMWSPWTQPTPQEVVVGPRSSLAVARLRLRDVNWIGEGELADLPADGLPIAARVRSTRPPAPALLSPTGEIEFAQPESGVSPGQACVFYASVDPNARVLGGGFIAAG